MDNLLSQLGLVLGGVVLALILLVILTVKSLIVIVPPNIAAVITGRKRIAEEGHTVGYRTVMGGRTMRIPIIEQVNWLSLSTIPLELSVEDAFSKGNIPLTVKAIANVKIASDPETVFNNAVERLLGKNIGQIEALARETLTGNLRGVLAKLTPEEVNEDRLGFAKHLSDEADHDLKKLGLQLDVLKIQHVADRVGYLAAIGEKRTAEALRDAEIAKASAVAETRQKQAEARKLAEVAQAENEAEIKQRQRGAAAGRGRRRRGGIADPAAAGGSAPAGADRGCQCGCGDQAATGHGAAAGRRGRCRGGREDRRGAQPAPGSSGGAGTRGGDHRARGEDLGAEGGDRGEDAHGSAARGDGEDAIAGRRGAARRGTARGRGGTGQGDRGADPGAGQGTGRGAADALRGNPEGGRHRPAGVPGGEAAGDARRHGRRDEGVEVQRMTIVDSGSGQGLANATTQKVNASIAALEQVAGTLGLDLEKFVKRVAGQDDGRPPVEESKRVKG